MAFIQGTGVESAGAVASLARAYGSNVTAGNVLMVGIATFRSAGSGATISSVTDTLSNSWARCVEATFNSVGSGDDSVCIAIWATQSIAAGGACTVTVTPNANAFMGIVIAEASNVARPTTGVTATGAGGTGADSGSQTGATNTLFFGIVTHDDATTRTITPGASQTQIFEDETINGMPVNGTYRITSGTINSTWTVASLPAAEAWFAAQAMFLPAGFRSRIAGGRVVTE